MKSIGERSNTNVKSIASISVKNTAIDSVDPIPSHLPHLRRSPPPRPLQLPPSDPHPNVPGALVNRWAGCIRRLPSKKKNLHRFLGTKLAGVSYVPADAGYCWSILVASGLACVGKLQTDRYEKEAGLQEVHKITTFGLKGLILELMSAGLWRCNAQEQVSSFTHAYPPLLVLRQR